MISNPVQRFIGKTILSVNFKVNFSSALKYYNDNEYALSDKISTYTQR